MTITTTINPAFESDNNVNREFKYRPYTISRLRRVICNVDIDAESVSSGVLENIIDFEFIRNFKRLAAVHILNGQDTSYIWTGEIKNDTQVELKIYDTPGNLSTDTTVTENLTMIIWGV